MIRSWVESANAPTSDFPLQNLPCGVFSANGMPQHCGVAIGDMIVDVTELELRGLLSPADHLVFDAPFWNNFMALGPEVWDQFRERLTALLAADAPERSLVEPYLVRIADAQLHMPFLIAEYTDFYASRHHAFNVGSMFRDPANALPPNWLHIPIGYNGRASSVVLSGTDVVRPNGQLKPPQADTPHFGPSERFDFELELGAIVGLPSYGMVSVDVADEMIFGFVLLNDWSARDIQAWEYQPLGPFQSKATATTISPWIVMKAALEPFRVPGPSREVELLPYLRESRPMLFDIAVEATIMPEGKSETVLSRTNYAEMYYSAAQQLAHHTTSGCPMNTGDLLGSGTISGPTQGARGSLLELSWSGKEPLMLSSGETRSFIEDGDTITVRGHTQGDGYRIGFGECSGKVVAAQALPEWATSGGF
jgi:fumarylacetoacetase